MTRAAGPSPDDDPATRLGDDPLHLLLAVRGLHEDIRARTGELLERARVDGNADLAAAPGAWGAGDLNYALDDAAEEALEVFGRALGARHPLALVSEGPGLQRFGEGAAGQALRVLVDPVDGTRSLMHDMRSAWAVTAVAPDHGELTRLSDADVAVQTELPTTGARHYRVLTAIRGRGARIATHDVDSGDVLDERPLVVEPELPIENGYLCFTRFLAAERPLVAALEAHFLDEAIAAHALSPRLLYDDQYLCNAGQMFFVTTGRYRMLADLRGWLHHVFGVDNFTSKPYDMAALRVYTEAGVPVLDEHLAPLDAPMDTSTRLSIIAFANTALAEALLPQLRDAMEALAAHGA